MWVPVPADGVYVAEHVDVLAVAGDSVQGLPEKAPVPEEENVTAPVGADFVPAAVSATVAVQVEGWFSVTGLGEHVTEVDVLRRLLNVTVSACAAFDMLKLQGLVVPVHVVVPPLTNVPLQPVNADPAFAVTVNVPVALLSRATLHVATHGFGLGAGDAGLTPLNATEPPPDPANVSTRFLFAIR